jgi:hypothetical protein
MKQITLFVLVACALAVAASAQDATTFTFEKRMSADQAPPVTVAGTQFKMAFEAKVVPNAPYQAEATTESVMTLADGNRIVKKTTTRVYRDSAGRTRRETLGPDGQVTSVFISDPVAKTTFAVDPQTQTASRASVFYAISDVDGEPALSGTISHATTSQSAGTVTVATSSGAGTTNLNEVRKSIVVSTSDGGVFKVETDLTTKGDITKEDLGEQTIEGVLAKGSRTTTVMPVGAVDNEQPIRIVSEEWFSPELQVLVLTKHSDPRVGETTYRLASISRTEPVKSLFELPANYTIKTPEAGTQMKVIQK